MALERQKIRENGNKPPVHRTAIASKGKGAPKKAFFWRTFERISLLCA